MTTPVQTAALLLERVPAITKNFEKQYRETGVAYNIFKVAGINEREVIMCRVLADLLDPKGLHYRGGVYLKLFMDMVVKPLIKNTGNFDPSKAKVTTEYSINENRRIDIVMDDGTIFIPIEVKIYAGEQEKQLADYASFSRKMNVSAGFVPVLFLTPDGRESYETSKDDYIPISFEKHIIPWLVKCLNLNETDKASPIREILKQFIKAIKSFCGHMEGEEMEKAITALIAESKDNYEAALQIYDAIDSDELDFDEKTRKIFNDRIFNLVKVKIPETKYLEKEDENWYFFQIPIGKDYMFYVNYNLDLMIEPANAAISTVSDAANKIKRRMFDITGFRGEDWGEGYVWASSLVKYPGLENIDNDKIYKYELYGVFLQKPQAAADRIVSMVMELRNI